MEIREATIADLAAIMAIENACFETDAWSEAVMSSELEAKHTHYILGLEGDQVVGYAGLSKLPLVVQADIQTIAVSPQHRTKGLGRALMANLMAKASELSAEEVFLEVRADNEVAQRLYESLGFSKIGIRKHYYQPDDVDAIVMRADVK
jgi:ribosomal-protein-alanine acetyltransferase